MSENFKETLNLKERMDDLQRQKQQREFSLRKKQERSRDLDRLFKDGGSEEEQQKKMQRINRPENKPAANKYILPVFVVVIIILASIFYFALKERGNKDDTAQKEPDWCAVKLINGEVYYGQISNKESDPVIIKNVYYNYDQLKKDSNNPSEEEKSASLRLVKRGNEAHGPSGSMNIVRAQVVYMESLKPDSKVLRAILDYEK